MRRINAIVIHCSATPEGKAFTAEDIDAWHRRQGWSGIGYHYVICLDGKVEKGRPVEVPGCHVKGHNLDSLAICYIGGCDAVGRKAKDSRTPAQRAAMRTLVDELLRRFPEARVCGHRDFPGVAKECPSFDVAAWLKESAAVGRGG